MLRSAQPPLCLHEAAVEKGLTPGTTLFKSSLRGLSPSPQLKEFLSVQFPPSSAPQIEHTLA